MIKYIVCDCNMSKRGKAEWTMYFYKAQHIYCSYIALIGGSVCWITLYVVKLKMHLKTFYFLFYFLYNLKNTHIHLHISYKLLFSKNFFKEYMRVIYIRGKDCIGDIACMTSFALIGWKIKLNKTVLFFNGSKNSAERFILRMALVN